MTEEYVKKEKDSDITKRPPLWGSVRLTVTILCFFTLLHLMSMRFNFSMAMVCMTGTKTEAENATTNQTDTQAEFDWDRSTVGFLLGSFFYGYVLTLILGGFVADRVGVKTGLGISLACLSLSSLVMPVLARWHFSLVAAMRAMQGCISGIIMPLCYNAYTIWSSPIEKSTMMALGFSGGTLSFIITHPISSLICYESNWAFMFYIPALTCGLTSLGFFLLTSNLPEDHGRISSEEKEYLMKYSCRNIGKDCKRNSKASKRALPLIAMMKSLPVHALWIVHLCQVAVFYFISINIPLFIDETFQLGMIYNGILCGLPFILVIAMNYCGRLFDVIVNSKKISPTNLRKLVTAISLLVPSVLFCFMNNNSAVLRMALLMLCVTLNQLSISAGFFTSHAELAGDFSGRLFGFTNTMAQTGGLINPLIISYLVPNGTRNEWQNVFYLASLIGIVGALVYVLFGSSERQPWADHGAKQKVYVKQDRLLANIIEL